MWCKRCNKYINGRKHKVTHRKDCGEIISTVKKLDK